MTQNEANDRYAHISIPQFYELILARDDNSEIAVFYLLRYRLIEQLRRAYEDHRLQDDLCDLMMDFFFYLRDGENRRYSRIFQGLENLRSAQHLERYIVVSFQYFLINRLELEIKQRTANIESINEDKYDFHKEVQIHCLGQIIAYLDSTLNPLKLFIFYHSIMELLDSSLSVPHQLLAQRLGISYDNYRKIESRAKAEAMKTLTMLKQGKDLNLDLDHQLISQQIEEGYDDLMPIIRRLYYQAAILIGFDFSPAQSSSNDDMKQCRYQRPDDSHLQRKIEERRSCLSACLSGLFDRLSPLGELPTHPHSETELLIDFSDLSKKEKLWNRIKNSWLENREFC